MKLTNGSRAFYNWLGNLRVIATICVIIIHVSFPLLLDFKNNDRSIWWIGNVYDSLSRHSVPIFVMITGSLFLNRDIDWRIFFTKRLTRVLYPFFFWSIIYITFLSKWDFISHSLRENINYISSRLVEGASYHLWYVYMIIWLLLFMPILNTFVKKLSKKQILYLLAVWLILITTMEFIGFSEMKSSSFCFYIGYLILGYYLTIQQFNLAPNHLKKISLGIFITCALLTIFGTYYLSVKSNQFNGFFYGYFTFNVLLSSIGLFLFFKLFGNDRSLRANRTIELIDSHGYGVYLVHVLVLFLLDKIKLNAFFIHPLIGVPITVTACLAISICIIYLIRLIPFGKYLSG